MEDFCTICNESQNTFLNQQQKFVSNNVQGCGHLFCHTCVARQLDRKKSFACPACGTTISKLTLSEQSLDMKYCDDDATWRKRVLAVYNKSEADFSTLVAYNDYLEEVEDIVFCIVNDDPSAGGLIEKVKELEHTDEKGITERQSQKAEDARMEEEKLSIEDREFERQRQERNNDVLNERALKERLKKQKMQVNLGERKTVDDGLRAQIRRAEKIGYANAILKDQASKVASTMKNVRVFVNGELRDLKVVRAMKGDALKNRIQAGGGVLPNTTEDREMCWEECMGSLFL